MAKKPNTTAADDLIKSLLDDVNGDDTSDPQQEDIASSQETIGKSQPFLVNEESNAEHKDGGFPEGFNPQGIDNEFKKEGYQGPSLDNVYQTPLDLEKTAPAEKPKLQQDEKTIPLPSPHVSEYGGQSKLASENTIDKVVINTTRNTSSNFINNLDATLAQAENLKLAQQRILDLEKEVDRLRQENEEVSSAAEIITHRTEEMQIRLRDVEKERDEVSETAQGEILILKGQLEYKETELGKALRKIEDLEIRLKNDFRKVRVRERELENRLELLRAEKTALIRSKDDNILELKRKVDQLQHEIDNYREKCLELNKTLESHKEQFKRTVRALKLALTNLEAKDDDVIPLKKAE